MAHELEDQYGLTSDELLDGLARRFRAKVTLEGVVAEVQLERKIKAALSAGLVVRYVAHDQDGYPDYSIWLPGVENEIRIECKNVRDSDEAYRHGGMIVGYKVECQKTRASKGDALSRFYGFHQFEILAVCLGKKNRDWSSFLFIWTKDLNPHSEHPGKLAVMQRVPVSETAELGKWYGGFDELLKAFEKRTA